MSERAVGDVCDVELTRRLDQSVGLVQSLKGRVLGLDGIDLGD